MAAVRSGKRLDVAATARGEGGGEAAAEHPEPVGGDDRDHTNARNVVFSRFAFGKSEKVSFKFAFDSYIEHSSKKYVFSGASIFSVCF